MRRVRRSLGAATGPPHSVAEERGEARDEDAGHQDRDDQDPGHDREAHLREQADAGEHERATSPDLGRRYFEIIVAGLERENADPTR
jgi:hypothetical protein